MGTWGSLVQTVAVIYVVGIGSVGTRVARAVGVWVISGGTGEEIGTGLHPTKENSKKTKKITLVEIPGFLQNSFKKITSRLIIVLNIPP
jgi:hypothetical protein